MGACLCNVTALEAAGTCGSTPAAVKELRPQAAAGVEKLGDESSSLKFQAQQEQATPSTKGAGEMGSFANSDGVSKETPPSPRFSEEAEAQPGSVRVGTLDSIAERGPEAKDTPQTGTLTSVSGDLSERHQAYLARKARKEKKRKEGDTRAARFTGNSLLQKDGVLSNVPEFEADIQFRFAFVVVGTDTKNILEAVCACDEAKLCPTMPNEPGDSSEAHSFRDSEEKLQSANDELETTNAPGTPRPELSAENPGTPAGRTPKHVEEFRCLCPIPYPISSLKVSERLKFAKLVFHALSFSEDVPRCSSRLEALSSSVVFVLTVDEKDRFDEQIWSLTWAIQESRLRTRQELRPVEAVLLIQTESSNGNAEISPDSWRPRFEEFSTRHGPFLLFGPFQRQDGDSIYGAFATIAAQRIDANLRGETDIAPIVEEESETYETEGSEMVCSKPNKQSFGRSFSSMLGTAAQSVLRKGSRDKVAK